MVPYAFCVHDEATSNPNVVCNYIPGRVADARSEKCYGAQPVGNGLFAVVHIHQIASTI